ncbi:hypothetical protein QQF64_020190 [Cirrhinus molitorella]|uniref:HAT C-terminal dimerisation domain-containing protein n=1 Tax=Cirrhinus molitorella TaxID=172907 RepID=A0ABR3L8D5_9TELE
MHLTFSYRWQELVEDLPVVYDLQSRWPALFTINTEFMRIRTVPLLSKFLAQLDKYTANLEKVFSCKGGASGQKISRIMAVAGKILQYGVDQSLPTFTDEEDAVSWWADVSDTGRYPALTKTAQTALSVFHGPLIESSFSYMSEIIDSKSGSMSISTLSAIQTVKHTMLTQKKTAVEMFNKENIKYGPVDQKMCQNILSAGSKDKALRKQAALKEMERRRVFDCQPSSSPAAARRTKAEEEALARRRHAAKQRKQACETLVQAKKGKKMNVCKQDCVKQSLCVYLNDYMTSVIKEFQDCNPEEAERVSSETTLGLFVIRKEGAAAEDEPADVGVLKEGVKLLQHLKSISFGLVMIFGLIYALNLSYPQSLKFTFEFFQKCLQITLK